MEHVRDIMRAVVEAAWLEQTSHTKLRDDQSMVAKAISYGNMATRLAQMSCDVGSLASIDLSADSADGMCS